MHSTLSYKKYAHSDVVYIGIDIYTFLYWMMPIMLSYLVYIHLLNQNQILLNNDGKDWEIIAKIESVWSIYAKTDEEPESVHSSIDNDISNYEMFNIHNIPIQIIYGLQMSIPTFLPYIIMTGADVYHPTRYDDSLSFR